MTQKQWTDTDRSGAGPEYLHADLTHEIIGGFYKVYNYFGFGFGETGYKKALAIELRQRGLKVEEEVVFKMIYYGIVVAVYRADLVVEDKVIVESKAGIRLDPTTIPQLLNYLRLSKLQVGLALHFGPTPSVKRLISSRFEAEDIPGEGPQATS